MSVTAATQPLQQLGDLMLQDIEDDLIDNEPIEASSLCGPHVHTSMSQQVQPAAMQYQMKPIMRSEVSTAAEENAITSIPFDTQHGTHFLHRW